MYWWCSWANFSKFPSSVMPSFRLYKWRHILRYYYICFSIRHPRHSTALHRRNIHLATEFVDECGNNFGRSLSCFIAEAVYNFYHVYKTSLYIPYCRNFLYFHLDMWIVLLYVRNLSYMKVFMGGAGKKDVAREQFIHCYCSPVF